MTPTVTQKVIGCPDPAINDSGKVRLGTTSPTFPPLRSAPASARRQGSPGHDQPELPASPFALR
jgi:hypothetical protein